MQLCWARSLGLKISAWNCYSEYSMYCHLEMCYVNACEKIKVQAGLPKSDPGQKNSALCWHQSKMIISTFYVCHLVHYNQHGVDAVSICSNSLNYNFPIRVFGNFSFLISISKHYKNCIWNNLPCIGVIDPFEWVSKKRCVRLSIIHYPKKCKVVINRWRIEN